MVRKLTISLPGDHNKNQVKKWVGCCKTSFYKYLEVYRRSPCLGWLGVEISSEIVKKDSKEFWIAQNVGEFLLKDMEITDSFSTNLKNLIEQTANGNINDFAHFNGVWHLAIRRLLKGKVLPTLEMLIAICYPLDFPINNLFIKSDEIGKLTSYPNNQSEALTKEEVEIRLPSFLTEHSPPSLNEICRQIGWSSTRFQRHFSDAYKQIVERYQHSQTQKLPKYSDTEIRKILLRASTEDPPPSLQSVFRKIECRNTGFRYYQRFPDLCEQISRRFKQANRKVFDFERNKRVMKSALREIPVPSFSEVARRIGCTRETLNKKFPEMSTKLHQKYADFIKEIREENKRDLYEVIIKMVMKLQSHGKPITENSIRKLLEAIS